MRRSVTQAEIVFLSCCRNKSPRPSPENFPNLALKTYWQACRINRCGYGEIEDCHLHEILWSIFKYRLAIYKCKIPMRIPQFFSATVENIFRESAQAKYLLHVYILYIRDGLMKTQDVFFLSKNWCEFLLSTDHQSTPAAPYNRLTSLCLLLFLVASI